MSAATDVAAGDPVVWARALGVSTGEALHGEVSRMARGVEDLWVQVGSFADQVGPIAMGDVAHDIGAARVELGEALSILESTAARAGEVGHLGSGW